MEKTAEKRSAEEQQSLVSDVKAVLLEVDGSVIPISFIKEKFYEYVKEHTEEYLKSNFDNKDVQTIIESLKKQAGSAASAGEDVTTVIGADAEKADIIKAIVDNIKGQLSKGKVTDPLRKVVWIVWQDGFKKKAIVGELFDDVVPALKELTEQGTKVYLYSSHCSDTQRLLFGHSKDGDQSELISGYFDVSAGPRTDKDTYVKIAKDLEQAPSDVLYLTHQSTEATAAHAAGMKTALVIRPGNPELSEKDLEKFHTISSFAELFGEGERVEVPQKKVCHEHPTPPKIPQPATHAAQAK